VNVLLVSHQLDRSGAPIALLHLARALIDLGHSVSLISFRTGPLIEEFQVAGVKISSSVGPNEFNVCFLNTVFGCQFAPNIRPLVKTVIAWIHESPTFYRYHPKLSFDAIPDDHIDIIMGVAGFQVAALKDRFPKKTILRFDNTFYVPLGHQEDGIEKSQVGFDDNVLKVAIVGSLEPRKGLNALAQLVGYAGYRIIEFHCAGLTDLDIPKISGELLLNPFIKFVCYGKVGQGKVLEILRNSDLLLSLSHDEVKPLTILEAISVGTPVVCADIPAHSELAHEFGNLILVSRAPLTAIRSFEKVSIDRRRTAPCQHPRLRLYNPTAFLGRADLLLQSILAVASKR
jgi:glycosyltransferase involved in cell wall biosynthesis